MAQHLTFRNSKIVYYGPHECGNCGVSIAAMGNEWGGSSFTYPEGPIYPNTEWHPHVCDPMEVVKRNGSKAEREVKNRYPHSIAFGFNSRGFVIFADGRLKNEGRMVEIISHNQTYCDTPESAWISALDRQQLGYPTWEVNFAAA